MLFSMKRCFLKPLLNRIVFIILPFVFITFSCTVNASEIRYIGFSPDGKVNAYTGQSWSDYGQGLPDNIVVEKITEDSIGTFYLTSESSGIFKRNGDDTKWVSLSTPDLRRRTQLEGVNEYRRISAFCVDPANPKQLYLATKHVLYSSTDYGKTWKHLVIQNNKNSYYFTSLTIHNGTLYGGTSFNGIVAVKNGRATEIDKGIPKEYYAGTLHFCEGVSALSSINNQLYSGYLFSRGVCVLSDPTTVQTVPVKINWKPSEGVYDLAWFHNSLIVSTDENVYQFSPENGSTTDPEFMSDVRESFSSDSPSAIFVRKTESTPALFIKKNLTRYSVEKENPAGSKRVLYTNWGMLNSNFNKLLNVITRNGFNAVIIDIKDDYGIINAPIQSKTALEIGAVRNTKIAEIVKAFHAKGIWVIARNVTFKDKRLYSAYKGKYAIWDRVSNTPWVGLPRENWCDPYSQFVRDYNIEIAKETAKFGFDEIQFDYIRFPTDGAVGRCQFRYKENSDTFKSEILADFLQQARKEVGLPISVDIYGYNGWYRFGNLIGQDIEFLSRFVDVICPMVYPSHFGGKFYNRFPVADRPYEIVKDSTIRGIYLSHNRSVIRPWIQDFKYLSPTWGTEYILTQIKGVDDGGGFSFSFWNPAGDHSMADKALNGKDVTP